MYHFPENCLSSIADLRTIKTIADSAGKVLQLFENNITNGIFNQIFIGLVNGDRLGEAMASIVDEKTIIKIPSSTDYYARENRAKYSLCNTDKRIVYELFIGDIYSTSGFINQLRYLCSTEEDLRKKYKEVTLWPCPDETSVSWMSYGSPKTAYILKHYFTDNNSLITVSEYTPLHGI